MNEQIMEVLQKLLNNTSIKPEKLEELLHLSYRQLRYRLSKLNILLEENGQAPIVFRNGQSIFLPKETKITLMRLMDQYTSKKNYHFSKKERGMYLYLMLFLNLDYLTINHLTDSLNVSRSSVLSDLKYLSSLFGEDHVKLNNNRDIGYYLEGDEIVIRWYAIKTIVELCTTVHGRQLLNRFLPSFDLLPFDAVLSNIKTFAKEMDVSLVEDRLIEFTYLFILLSKRIQSVNKKQLFFPEIMMLHETKEYQFADKMLQYYKIEKADVFDTEYLAAWILGVANGNADQETSDRAIISEMVKKLLARFESLSGVHYTNYTDIYKQLYAHLRPAYYRLLFKFPIVNTYSSKIKEEYAELYHLVEKTMEPFSALFDESVPEEELAYLALHFGTVLTSTQDKFAVKMNQYIAAIVCTHGIGSSAILYTELSNLFPDFHFIPPLSPSEFKLLETSVDLVFSTNYAEELLAISDAPIIPVSPVMTAREKFHLERDVYIKIGGLLDKKLNLDDIMQIIEQHAVIETKAELRQALYDYLFKVNTELFAGEFERLHLLDILKEDYICLNVQADNWMEAIELSAKPLLDAGNVSKNYVQEIIRKIEEIGPYVVIMQQVALSHTRIDAGSFHASMGLAVLETPIDFGDPEHDPVQYIFTLSTVDNESHLQAMAELVALLENSEFFTMLNNAKTQSEVISYIQERITS